MDRAALRSSALCSHSAWASSGLAERARSIWTHSQSLWHSTRIVVSKEMPHGRAFQTASTAWLSIRSASNSLSLVRSPFVVTDMNQRHGSRMSRALSGDICDASKFVVNQVGHFVMTTPSPSSISAGGSNEMSQRPDIGAIKYHSCAKLTSLPIPTSKR